MEIKSSRIAMYEIRQAICEIDYILDGEEFTVRDLHGLYPNLCISKVRGIIQKAKLNKLVTFRTHKDYDINGCPLIGVYKAHKENMKKKHL